MKRSSAIGIIYLIIALVGGFSMGYFPITYIDLNNTEQTFTTLKENLLVFQLNVESHFHVSHEELKYLKRQSQHLPQVHVAQALCQRHQESLQHLLDRLSLLHVALKVRNQPEVV